LSTKAMKKLSLALKKPPFHPLKGPEGLLLNGTGAVYTGV